MYFKSLLENMRDKNRDIETIYFDGIEVITDTVLYVFYKYFKEDSMWKPLESIRLDGCRYVTDFGVELISHATNKESLLKPGTFSGCKKIVKYAHVPCAAALNVKHRGDMFLCDSFNKCANSSSTSAKCLLNAYKIFILNNTELNLTHFLEHKKVVKDRKIINYAQFNVESTNHTGGKLKFNIIETDAVSLIFNYNFQLHDLTF